jgi:glycosyltransferase involved in cell wall biosynthesis
LKKNLLINHTIDYGNITLEKNLKNLFGKKFSYYSFNKLDERKKNIQKINIYKFLLSFRLRKIFRSYNFNKIIFNSLGPAIWTYGSYDFSKTILFIDWIDTLENFFLRKKIKFTLKFKLQKKILNKFPIILCRTLILKNHLIKTYNINSNKLIVMEAPFIFDKFDQKPKKVKAKPNVLFIGNDFKRKGGELLIKNVDKLRKICNLTLVTNHNKVKYLKILKYITYGSKTHLKLFKNNDIFILPSRFDPYGMVIPEAMSSSLAVITSKNVLGAYNYIKNNKNGIICDNPNATISKLCSLLKNKNKINLLKKNAYQTMKKKHNVEIIKNDLLKILNV